MIFKKARGNRDLNEPRICDGRKKGTLISQQGVNLQRRGVRSNVLRRARSQSALKTSQWSQSLNISTIGSGAEAGLGPQR